MLETLSATCEASDCDRELTADRLMIEMDAAGGVRRAYECSCGAVTITVVRG